MTNHLIFILFVITLGFVVESRPEDEKKHGRPKYVVIDTDGGVDDALALMLLFDAHKKGRMKVLAVTTTYGNTDVDQVVRNIMQTRHVMGTEDIKVYRGADSPMHSLEGYRDNYFGDDGFGNASDSLPQIQMEIEDEPAAMAISRLAKQHPKKITMITMGPLTNLAMAVLLNPDLSDELKQIIAMGGLLDIMGGVGPTQDFNFYNDPEAVDIVFRKTTCPLTIITLDSCRKNFQSMRKLMKITKVDPDSRADFFNKITEYVFQNDNGDGIVLGDIFAAITALAPKHIKKWDEYSSAMEMRGTYTRGRLAFNSTRGAGSGGDSFLYERVDFEGLRNAYFIREFDFDKCLEMVADMLGE